MDVHVMFLVILFVVRCDAGVVRQLTFDDTDPVNTDTERVSHDVSKIQNNSTQISKNSTLETSKISIDDDHNLTVSTVGFHNISQDTTQDHALDTSHNFLNNDSKDFNRSQQSLSKGSGRSKKKLVKGTNRFRNSPNKQTKHVVKNNFHNDTSNDSHHSKEFSHSDEEAAQISNHSENFIGNLNTTIDNLDLSDNFENKSSHFDEDDFSVSHHSDVKPSIQNDRNINGSHIDDIVKDFNNFKEQSITESNRGSLRPTFNNSNEFDHFGSVNEQIHQEDHIVAEHFKNRLNNGSDTPRIWDTTEEIETSNQPSDNLGRKDETTVNNFEVTEDHVNFTETNHTSESEEFKVIGHNSSDLTDIHEDVTMHNDTNWETHSESVVAEENLFNPTENFSSKIEPMDIELEGHEDINILGSKDNSSDIFLNLTIFDQHLKESNQAESILVNHHINESIPEDVYVMFTVTPNEDESNSATELSHDIRSLNVNIEDLEMNKSESSVEISNPNIKAVENTTGGLFSGISFDFLINSELAKNAAGAMEVFNFTDSALTDHIVDDNNDVHDFLDLMHPPSYHSLRSADDSSPNSKLPLDHGEELSTPFSNDTNLETLTVEMPKDKDRDQLNGSDEMGNGTVISTLKDEVEITTMTSQPLLNSTVVFEETSMIPQPIQSSTVEFEKTTMKVSTPTQNSTVEFVDDAVCPPPGICIFWFLAQDTCAVNSHCLGSRICCRIGCAKTCIEV